MEDLIPFLITKQREKEMHIPRRQRSVNSSEFSLGLGYLVAMHPLFGLASYFASTQACEKKSF